MVCGQLAVGVGAGVVFAPRVHHVVEESSLGFTGMMVDALASVGGILRVKMQVWALNPFFNCCHFCNESASCDRVKRQLTGCLAV